MSAQGVDSVSPSKLLSAGTITYDEIVAKYADEGAKFAILEGKDYRVVRLDLPAFGLTGSVPSGNYSIDRYLMLVDSLMDQLGIERFAIAGTSYGGLVAFRYAGTRTDRVPLLFYRTRQALSTAAVEASLSVTATPMQSSPQRVLGPPDGVARCRVHRTAKAAPQVRTGDEWSNCDPRGVAVVAVQQTTAAVA
ncbi:MAG: alpha/beta hydrolase [Pseudomonadales bacterium]